MSMKLPNYLAYMLRMWRISDHSKEVWRASLESPGAGMRYNFTTIDDLIEFLRNEITDAEAEIAAKDE